MAKAQKTEQESRRDERDAMRADIDARQREINELSAKHAAIEPENYDFKTFNERQMIPVKRAAVIHARLNLARRELKEAVPEQLEALQAQAVVARKAADAFRADLKSKLVAIGYVDGPSPHNEYLPGIPPLFYQNHPKLRALEAEAFNLEENSRPTSSYAMGQRAQHERAVAALEKELEQSKRQLVAI